MSDGQKKKQTPGEEIANTITHGVGAALAVAALVVLVTFAGIFGDAWRVVSFSIYGATLILLYLSSTLYHGLQAPKAKKVFHIFDRTAIYLLIAGSYTPFFLVSLRGSWGWAFFGVIWGLAVIGIVLTVFFVDRYNSLSVATYIGMGWLAVLAIKPLMAAISISGLAWLVIGGLFYTSGVIFYAWKRLPFNHMVWHIFVLGGSISHFFCILFYVLPMNPPQV
jgi:hemolysin III